MEYVERFYRDWPQRPDLHSYRVVLQESDLLILSDLDPGCAAHRALGRARGAIERAIEKRPEFLASLEPLEPDSQDPSLVRQMIEAGRAFGVGPMAAVAGAVAGAVGRALARNGATVIVENGGDIYAKAPEPVRFALYAGEESPFAGRVGFVVDATASVGVCTSSGKVGPSLSLGRADAVVAVAEDPALADAAATALANRIRRPEDIDEVIEDERRRGRLIGAIAACEDRLGAFGALELFRVNKGEQS